MTLTVTDELIRRAKLVVIGASAGAIEALRVVLPSLPANFPLPILIVVHVPPHTESLLAELFADTCSLTVHEACDKEPLQPGTVYFAPPDYHLLVESNGRVSLAVDELVQFARPSIDVLFESAAAAFGDGVIGIILSGANHDGANGLRAVGAAGGVAIANDPEEAYIRTMPEAALSACKTSCAMRLLQIAEFLKAFVGKAPSSQWIL